MATPTAVAMQPSKLKAEPPSTLAANAPAEAPPRKELKASDLPLSSAVRSAIEGLAHTFKKKGGYDTIRKQAWEKFEASVGGLSYPSRLTILQPPPPSRRQRCNVLLNCLHLREASTLLTWSARLGLSSTGDEGDT